MNWFRNLDTIVQRVIMACLVFCVLIVVLLTVGFCDQRDRTRQAEGQASVATSQGNLGADALKRSDDMNAANDEGAAQTGRNTDFITGADNAKTDAGDAGNRGRLAFCDRQRVRNRPEPEYCPALRRTYSAQPTPAD